LQLQKNSKINVRLHDGYVKTLVALLIQISCCCDLHKQSSFGAIYWKNSVLVWSTHTFKCCCNLFTQFSFGLIYSHI